MIRVFDKKINHLFLRNYIESRYFKRELNKRIIHVTFPKKINLGDIADCNIAMPIIEEQEKIANILIKVDKIIGKQEKK